MRQACRGRAILLAISTGAGLSLAAGRNGPLTTAELLVDLARDHGLVQRGRQTPADADHIRALLEAAAQLDPSLPTPYAWLYELAVLAGNQAAADTYASRLVETDPRHERAFELWLEAGARAQQTMEKRMTWLHAVAETERPAPLKARVYVELARCAWEQLDRSAARGFLEQATKLEPASREAAALTLAMVQETDPPAAHLRALLRLLSLEPFSLELAWQVGLLLDGHGLHAEAARFFDYVRDARAKANPLVGLPAPYQLDLARHRLARGQIDDALSAAYMAYDADDPASPEAGFFLFNTLTRFGRAAEAEGLRKQLAELFGRVRDPVTHSANELAQAAWYYSTVEPEPHLALSRARAAAERAPHDIFVQRVLGWALALNSRVDEARETLEPIADRDPFAAAILARMALHAGDRAAALAAIEHLDPWPTAGMAADWLADVLQQLATSDAATRPVDTTPQSLAFSPTIATAPATPPETRPATRPAAWPTTRPISERTAALRAVLREWDPTILELYLDPARFLEATCIVDDLGPAPGEPWWATFRLTNRARLPITLGPDGAVNPVFVLSFQMEGDRTRTYDQLLAVSVDRDSVLYPGESVEVRRTIDIGPVRLASRQTPQHMHRIALLPTLDAEIGPSGVWRASLGGQELQTVYFNRVPAASGRDAVRALISAVAGPSDSARWQAIEVLAALLGEAHLHSLQRLTYKPAPVPQDRIRALLLTLLESPNGETRARTLDALQLVGLDRAMLTAIERNLDHSEPLVRLLAVRLLARQGPAVRQRFSRIAREDDSPQVRLLAGSYLAQWEPPLATTQPADAPPPANSGPAR